MFDPTQIDRYKKMPKNTKSPSKSKSKNKSKPGGSVRKQPLNFVIIKKSNNEESNNDNNSSNINDDGVVVATSKAIPSRSDDVIHAEPSNVIDITNVDHPQQVVHEHTSSSGNSSSPRERNITASMNSIPLHSSPKKRNNLTITSFFSSPPQKKNNDGVDVELLDNSQAYFPSELISVNAAAFSQTSTDFQGCMQQQDTSLSCPSLSQSSKQNTPPKLTTTLTFKQKLSPNHHDTFMTSSTVTTNDTSSTMVTPKKPVKTLKMKDDTSSSKSKKKNESTKRKRSEVSVPHVESVNSSDSSEENQHFVSIKNKNTDEIVGTVAPIFLTKEQKKRKKELQVLSDYQKNQEKRKEMNELFCKGSGEHPLMALQREQRKAQKEAKKSTQAEDHDFWQGVKPLACNVTTQDLKQFGNCQHVNYVKSVPVDSLCDTRSHNTKKFNIDDLLLPEDNHEITITVETESSQLIPLLTKLTSTSIEQPKSHRKLEKKVHDLSMEDTLTMENKLPQLERSVEILYPKQMWNTEKQHFKNEFKNLEEKKWKKTKALQEQQKIQTIDLDESSMESSNSNSGFERREIRRETLSEDLWFIKYRPTHSKQVICKNPEANEQLHEWLESWKQFLSKPANSSKQTKHSKKKKPKEEENRRKSKKEKEFFDAFTDDEEEEANLENCLIVYGPNSGKTASVSANATELGFAELGLDASKERTSKSVTELKETTQSRGLRESHETIIVIEDVDVTFKEESYSSFVNGIEKLVKTSKRPIILIADYLRSDSPLKSFCKKAICFLNEKPYLNRKSINDSTNKDTIDPHCKYLLDVTCYVYSICLCEGLNVDLERDILPVTTYFLGDLKKILLLLQFWLCQIHYYDTLTIEKRPSLLEMILGLNSFENYSMSVTSFRHAEDDFELMDQIDLPFYNYLNGNADSKQIPANFISLLSHADTLRKYNDESSCNVS